MCASDMGCVVFLNIQKKKKNTNSKHNGKIKIKKKVEKVKEKVNNKSAQQAAQAGSVVAKKRSVAAGGDTCSCKPSVGHPVAVEGDTCSCMPSVRHATAPSPIPI